MYNQAVEDFSRHLETSAGGDNVEGKAGVHEDTTVSAAKQAKITAKSAPDHAISLTKNLMGLPMVERLV